MEQLVLRSRNGQASGRDYALRTDRATVIGRDDDADVIVPDETVSRKHAVIVARRGEMVLEDCSRNGTTVNGTPVKFAILRDHDEITIGGCCFQVMRTGTSVPVPHWVMGESRKAEARESSSPTAAARPLTVALADPAPARRSVRAPGAPPPASSAPTENFRGSLADIALADLLQLLSGSRKSGILVLRNAQGVGRIYLDKGQVCHASIAEIESANPERVFYRLARWTDGTFEFEHPDGRTFANPISKTAEYLLLEAARQSDEISNLGPDLPPLHAEIYLASPLPAPLRELSEGDLDFIQVVLHHVTVAPILDHYGTNDFEGYTYLKSLLGRKFLAVGNA